MTVITGVLIQSEYSSEETVENIEVIIDSAIDTVNTDAETSIGYMTGAAGSKTLTVTAAQAAALKAMVAMKLTSNIVAGGSSESFGLGGVNKSTSQSSGANSLNQTLYDRAILRLIGRQTQRA